MKIFLFSGHLAVLTTNSVFGWICGLFLSAIISHSLPTLFFKRGEQGFRYLADVVRAVQDLQTPTQALNHTNLIAACDKLPQVVQLVHPEKPARTSEATTYTDTQDLNTNTDINSSQQPSTPSTSTSTGTDEAHSPVEINVRDMTAQLTCKICFSAVVGIILLPCGHLVCCISCAPVMVDCPICRKTVNGTVQAFMP